MQLTLLTYCVVCKVMEKLIRNANLYTLFRSNAAIDDMFDNNFISDYQHGFLPGQSCTTQLLKVLDKWTEIFHNDGALDVVPIYLDLAKVFDSVSHKHFLAKLQSCGIRGVLLQ